MRTPKSTQALAIALALSAASLGANAAGLGRLTVSSALGQPLNAEVEIVALQPGEEDSLSARLASAQAFSQAGIQLNPALLNVRFAIERKDGRPVLRLTSPQAIDEPFLELLIELQSQTGRLVREYTFLLDPPTFRAPVQAAPAATPKPAATPSAPAPRAEEKPAAAAPAPAAAAPGSTYEVKKGDTLAAIARRNTPAGVSLGQMLAALYRGNTDAFVDNNINRLRSGRILNIPSAEEAGSINAAEADKLVRSHMESFAAFRRSAGAAAAATPTESGEGQRQASGRITTKPEEPKAEAPQDKVRLSKADPAKPGSAASKAAQDDNATARSRALQEAQSRVSELEKNVSELQKLVEMRNQQLAQLESKAGAKAAPKAAEPAPAAKAEPKAEAKAEPKAEPKSDVPKAAEPAPKSDAAKAAEAPKSAEAAKDAAPAPKAADAPAPAAKAAPKKQAPPPPPPEPSIIDEFLGNPIYLGVLALVVILLGVYGWIAWKKKRAAQARFQDSMMSTGATMAAGAGAGAASVFNVAAAEPSVEAPSPSESPVSDASVASLDAEEVDPIAEADVYMAYGRDAQAEEILKEAVQKDPSRTPVYAKLLEIYSNRRDTQSFAQTAGKLKELTGGAGAEWDRAVALGAALDPQNQMYSGATPAAPVEAAPAAAALDLDLDLTSGGGEAAAEATEAAAPALDFDLGGETTPAATAESTDTQVLEAAPESKPADIALDFDLGATSTPAEPGAEAGAPAADGGNTIDFALDLDLGGDKPAESPAAAPAADAALDLSSISLDLGGADTPSLDPKIQEVATKLDLAKAYQDMGDKDGARELLNEVLKDGDETQKSQAQQLLSALG